MSGKDKVEHYVESILHHEQEAERWREANRKAISHDYALHFPDLSSGSETLDD
jgi:hypothetical protein